MAKVAASSRGGSKPGERRGGRKPGTPNKATADVKAAARLEGAAMLTVLVGIAKDEEAPPAARVAAATKVLEYAAGKPTQQIDLNVPQVPLIAIPGDLRPSVVPPLSQE